MRILKDEEVTNILDKLYGFLDNDDYLGFSSFNIPSGRIYMNIFHRAVNYDIKYVNHLLTLTDILYITDDTYMKLVMNDSVDIIKNIFDSEVPRAKFRILQAIIKSGNWKIIKKLDGYIDKVKIVLFYKLCINNRKKLYKEFLRYAGLEYDDIINYCITHAEMVSMEDSIKNKYHNDIITLSHIYYIMDNYKYEFIKKAKEKNYDYKKILNYFLVEKEWFAKNVIRV